jgi:hypothetical protein
MFLNRCARVGTFVVILAALTAHSADAQAVSIRRGTFVFQENVGELNISGNRGFSLQAGVTLDGGRFGAISTCNPQPECTPGRTVELDAFWSGNDLQGRATYRGETYDDVGALDGDSAAEIAFSGTVTMPAMSDPPAPVTVTVPFDFAGRFAFGLTGPEPQSVLLSGGGRVSLTLQPNGEAWTIERAVFRFTRVETR